MTKLKEVVKKVVSKVTERKCVDCKKNEVDFVISGVELCKSCFDGNKDKTRFEAYLKNLKK